MSALAEPEELRANPQAMRHGRKRIKELERELLHKDRARVEAAAPLVLSKQVRAIFQQGRGRMIGLEDRQSLSRDAGARLSLACEIAGIDARTLQRWRADQGLASGDGRQQASRPQPRTALSQAERAELVRVARAGQTGLDGAGAAR